MCGCGPGNLANWQLGQLFWSLWYQWYPESFSILSQLSWLCRRTTSKYTKLPECCVCYTARYVVSRSVEFLPRSLWYYRCTISDSYLLELSWLFRYTANKYTKLPKCCLCCHLLRLCRELH